MPDILSLTPSADSNTYLIGDLHGCIKAFLKVIEHCKLNDKRTSNRLIILGDLVDRGEDSPGIIQHIIDIQHRFPDKLYAIRGNHENVCLETIAAIETLVTTPNTLAKHFITDVVKNANTVFNEDSYYKLLQEYIGSSDIDDDAEDTKQCIYTILHHACLNGGGWLVARYGNELRGKNNEPSIATIKTYMNQLPYIIHVPDAKKMAGFNAVHAALPFTDEELADILANEKNHQLDEEDIDYVTWYRPSDHDYTAETQYRNSAATVTYVGHSIVGVEHEGEIIQPVRQESNTVNLDFGVYFTDVIPVVCHNRHTCELLHMKNNKAKFLADAAKQIQTHLKAHANQSRKNSVNTSQTT